ncbi:hypothetical protein PHMEG_0006125 [Phytophthora megakarya]|uniref:PiggyBac transposable element-derived protein domain-containing protein n=1 Tax=Phytophthora megakarya TaxID=4795 RepID=A0A225WPR7_9STRA|nr:hypothetical protein PHMEG_0006125 [Phytophthora megakarya]
MRGEGLLLTYLYQRLSTAYLQHCRLEVVCGSEQHADELGGVSPTQYSVDRNSEPAAVMKNLDKVLPPHEKGVYHAVVTDRFYTSIQLALQLLACNIYCIGTIQTNKKGFPPALISKDTTRPAGVARGSSTVAVAKCCPKLKAMLWWDRLPVYLLSTGSSTLVDTWARHVPGGCRVTIPCPSTMKNYHEWMDGVDIHDQLRLQRYSLQLEVRFRKYYKTILLGLVGMAITNAFIVYREAQKLRGEPPSDHVGFLTVLQSQLLQTSKADFVEEILSPGSTMPTASSNAIPPEHRLMEFPDWIKIGQRSATRFYCEACSEGNKHVYLCDHIRPGNYRNNTATCHQIWHLMLKNGAERPAPRVGRGIQMWGLGKKRRRRRKEGELKSNEAGDA